jgi:hypothetical protein
MAHIIDALLTPWGDGDAILSRRNRAGHSGRGCWLKQAQVPAMTAPTRG